MTRRRLLLVTTLVTALLVVTGLPAGGAIPPFGPVVTVAPAPSGCGGRPGRARGGDRRGRRRQPGPAHQDPGRG